ncbi:TonB-dependent receptor [Pedobacter sp. HMF7647]|uniref:TonB-dependent receptor n=1 Tax=Hufsiella arboris TaxID=2695275 RepID=A0A7K1Y9Z2_9SPHI|nr:outer membrane beta-barrel family protein [Hufsiella arboris]MXV50939.1 TonB-dependent receptor [Hufsiella arboris]
MKFYLSSFLLLFSAFFSYSQVQSGYTIKGVVADSASKKSLDFVTISLKKENQPFKTTLSKTDGTFNFNQLSNANYSVAVVAVGYTSKSVSIDLKNAEQGVINLGKIYLATESKSLKEVAVNAQRPVIKQEVDRIAYDVQADVESKSLNVLDMMRKVPMLSLDGDDNIQLQGKSNYKILINGKPSSMVAKNPKDVLKAMPASSIQKIEVITTPPAKYDSEGLAGIINIITNKKIDNGYNGNVNLRENFPVGGPGGGMSFTVKQGKFGASGYGGIGVWKQPQQPSSSTRLTTDTLPSALLQNGSRSFKNQFGYIGTELSYEIDTLNLLTAEINLNKGNFNSDGNQLSRLNYLDNADRIIQGYNLESDSKQNWRGTDLSLNYQLGFKNKKDRLLTFSYKYSREGEGQNDNMNVSDCISCGLPSYTQANDGSSTEQTIQADYVHPVKKLNIEAGLKGILRNSKSDFEYSGLDSASGQYIIVPGLSNKYTNKQNILGAYNSYTYNLKDWGFKAGLRIEETIVNANFISTQSNVDQNYFNFIPSISVSRKFKNSMSVNTGFTQRIQRPNIYNLNPFVDRSNPNFQSGGNPNLDAVVNNNFQLGFSSFKKGSINLNLNYSFANNTIQRVSLYDPETRVTNSTYQNIGKDKSLGGNLSVNYPLTKNWNVNLGGNLQYAWLQGIINGELLKNEGLNGYLYGNTGYKIKQGFNLNASFSYGSPNVMLQGKSSSYFYTSVTVTKDIIKDKLSFSAGMNNPFTKYRNYNVTTAGSDFSQTNFSQMYWRSYRFNINYKFGKLQGDIKKNQRKINNDDSSGGGKSTSN